MLLFLGKIVLNKQNLTYNLEDILQHPDFCDKISPKLGRVDELLSCLRDDLWFLAEFPYIDRHYRDTYYSFHSAKFRKMGRNCIRIHIFGGEIVNDNDFGKNRDFLKDSYLGFFIIRPLLNFPLGRSLISPKALKENNFLCCLMRQKVSLFGNSFEAYGFPHVAQDTETHSCAESSLWSFIEYFGSKYLSYKPLLPSQIVKNLLNITEHRLLPSIGLTEKELAKCLHDNGFQCLIYNVYTHSADNSLYELLRIYIESGIPLLLILGNDVAGHALLTIGHEDDMSEYKVPSDKKWVDVSFFKKKLVFIDDNMPPYQIADILNPTAHYQNRELQDLKLISFIVPLPSHMFLVAEKVYMLLERIFEDPNAGLSSGITKWITRLFLAGVHSFKKFVLETDDLLTPGIKEYVLRLDLPKFIWLCEIYHEDEITRKICSGLIIIDATGGSKSLASVLWYTLDEKMYYHDGSVWNKSEPINQFKMRTYQNNLKGEWNKWMN
jgi:hypothetical protein